MWENPEYISDKEYRNRIQPKWIQYCKNKLDNRPWYLSLGSHVRSVMIQDLYREGRLSGYLELMDFQQFNKLLSKDRYNCYYYRHWTRDRMRDHYIWNCNNGKHFQQNGTKKKVLSEHEQAKREWREFKKVRKDKAKTYPGRQPKPFCKRLRNRSYRNYVRNEMRKGRYEFKETLDSVTDIWWYD